MYLFQHVHVSPFAGVSIYLHSTMYLFQPVQNKRTKSVPNSFTFHYVSISTLLLAGIT